jgi:class 3 adenylate cyclase
MERRLAAVMMADVAGYGRLSQADEEGTRGQFQTDLREVFGPWLVAHHGRLVKTMGDGLLMEFTSVLAVKNIIVRLIETDEMVPAVHDRLTVLGVTPGASAYRSAPFRP